MSTCLTIAHTLCNSIFIFFNIVLINSFIEKYSLIFRLVNREVSVM